MDPSEERRAPNMAFWSSILGVGDARPDPLLAGVGLPWFDGLRVKTGELEKLRLLTAEPWAEGVRAYRGGVLKTEPGVGGAPEGGSPSSFRWLGVRGMSARLSLPLNNGMVFLRMLMMGRMRRRPSRAGSYLDRDRGTKLTKNQLKTVCRINRINAMPEFQDMR